MAPGLSWWEATPVEVPVRLRTRGSVSAAGKAAAVPDHSSTREWIAQKRRRERAQLDAAIARFAGKSMTFGEIGALSAAEFDLFLALLDQALAAPRSRAGVRSTESSDGRLRIHLRPASPSSPGLATIETPGGFLVAPDLGIEIEELDGGTAVAPDEPVGEGEAR